MSEGLRFGEWIEDQLQAHGWSQGSFAESLGVARQTVNGWVNGEAPPRRRTVLRIARLFKVDENEALVRAGYPPNDPDYRLPEKQINDDRVGYEAESTQRESTRAIFAANSDKLNDEQLAILEALIRQWAKEEE